MPFLRGLCTIEGLVGLAEAAGCLDGRIARASPFRTPCRQPLTCFGTYNRKSHVGGCQNSGPLLGPLNTKCCSVLRTQKRDHNFDNHPCAIVGAGSSTARLAGAHTICAPRCHRMSFTAVKTLGVLMLLGLQEAECTLAELAVVSIGISIFRFCVVRAAVWSGGGTAAILQSVY